MTMDTAGKAVLFSRPHRADLAHRGDARPEPGLPVDEPRDHARGHLRAGRDAHAAAGGARASSARGSTGSRCRGCTRGEHRSPRFARLGRAAVAPAAGLRRRRARGPGRARRSRSLSSKTAMPSIKVVPTGDSSRVGYEQVQAAFGPGATGPLQIVAPAADARRGRRCSPSATRDRARSCRPSAAADGLALVHGDPDAGPSDPARRRRRSTGCEPSLPGRRAGRRRGRREPRPRAGAAGKTPLVIGVVLGARLPAAAGRAAGAADRRRRRRSRTCSRPAPRSASRSGSSRTAHLHSLLGFQSQGFLDAWGPVFFFAMIFAISMDYTVFLLSSAKEHWDRSARPAARRWSAASPTPAA